MNTDKTERLRHEVRHWDWRRSVKPRVSPVCLGERSSFRG